MNKEKIVEHIVKWLKDYSDSSNTNGFVVGVSGGIDSALTSTLGALTGKPVLCLEMPIHQPKNQVDRAIKHIEFLKSKFPNVTSKSIHLTDVFEAFIKAVEDKGENEMALVNSRSRLRMTTLYYFAGMNNALVLGTGNKVEDFGIGFFTKYGDGGVDLSPIADLTKTEVYLLAEYLDIIPEILNAPPTDGLWNDDRTDEDQIGATYPELEWAMTFNGDVQHLTDRQKEVLSIYRKLNKSNQHKMKPVPVCLIPENLKH
ncbi:MAG: NAD(+) synthase [Vicingaceae bacterium]